MTTSLPPTLQGEFAHDLLVLAGWTQLAMVAVTPAIPWILGWKEDTAKLKPLTRQVFWTYSIYIYSSNACFGLVSALRPAWLLDGSPLARAVCGFIAAWWAARLGIQFLCYERGDAPDTWYTRLGEAGLTLGFAAWTLVYGALALGALPR